MSTICSMISMKNFNSNKIRVFGWTLAGLLLLFPAVAMQLSAEFNWGAEDFLTMALLLFSLGITLELIVKFVSQKQSRAVLMLLAGGLFVLTWTQLAVGIF